MTDTENSGFGVASFSFLAVFVAILPLIAPTVAYDDSGEFTLAALELGIAHPPGYPLFVLLGKIAIFLPLGGPAFRTGLFSAACFSLAAALAGWFAFRLTDNRLNLIFIPLAIAGCGIPLSQAVITEVHSLNLLMLVSVIGLFCVALYDESIKPALLGTFLLGLSTGNHHTSLLLIPPCLLASVWLLHMKNRASGKTLLIVFCVGLTILLFPPIRSSCNPVLDWWNPEELSNYWKALTRYQYEAGKTTTAADKGISYLTGYWCNLVHENLGIPLSAAAAAAAIYLTLEIFRSGTSKSAVGVFLLLSLASLSALFLLLLDFSSNPNSEFYNSYFMAPSLVGAACFGAAGIAWLISSVTAALLSGRAAIPCRPLLSRLLVGTCIFLLCTRAYGAFSREDMSKFHLYSDYARAVLKNLPESAVLLSSGDPYTFALWYIREVENQRRDIKIIDTNLMVMPWYWDGVVLKYLEILPPPVSGMFDAAAIRKIRFSQLFGMYSGEERLFTLFPLENIAEPGLCMVTRPMFPAYLVGRKGKEITVKNNSETLFSQWLRLRTARGDAASDIVTLNPRHQIPKRTALIEEAVRMVAVSACNQGIVLLTAGNGNEGEKWLMRAERLQPHDTDIARILRNHFQSVGTHDAGEKRFRKAVDPGSLTNETKKP